MLILLLLIIIIFEIRGLIIIVSPVQAFQKLIYVSNIVFGEASAFLLPWKRVFKVTDSQVFRHYKLDFSSFCEVE